MDSEDEADDVAMQGEKAGACSSRCAAISMPSAGDIDVLPPEVAGRVYNLLQPKDIKSARLVSRSWLREVSRFATESRPAVSKIRKMQFIFPALTHLDMSKAYGVTTEHLPQLAKLVRLTWLSLKRSRAVTDNSLDSLAPLTALTHLNLARCYKVTDVGVCNAVRALPQLRSLNLKFCYRLSDDGVATCVRLSGLQSLTLTSCNKVTDIGMGSIASLATGLKTLKLTDCPLIGDEGLRAATTLESLTTLECRLGHHLHAQRSDAGWTALFPRLRQLRVLALSCRGAEGDDDSVSDATLLSVAGLTNLEELLLDQAYAVTDGGVASLAALSRLTALKLHETRQLTDEGIAALCALTALRSVALGDQHSVTDRGIARLGASMALVTRLALSQCFDVTGVCAASFAGLVDLEVAGCEAVSDESVALLAGAAGRALTTLSLTSCSVTDAVLPQLATALPQLRALSLCDSQALKCEGVAALGSLTALTRLDLSLCSHLSDDPAMASLADLECLAVLNVSGCPRLTDAGLEILAKVCPRQLRHVTVAGCEFVTKSGAAELQGALAGGANCASPRVVEFNHQSPSLKDLMFR